MFQCVHSIRCIALEIYRISRSTTMCLIAQVLFVLGRGTCLLLL